MKWGMIMVYEIVNNFPDKIIYEEEGPFISLYQGTNRQSLNNKEDLIKFSNLTKEIENSLEEKYPQIEVSSLMKPFKDIVGDRRFWNQLLDGLAILANPNQCVVYKLERPVEELALVGDSFHIKPLLRKFQSSDRYHVLGINRNNFTLYEGNRYGFSEIRLDKDIPRTSKEVLGEDYTDSHLSHGSYGGAGGTPMFHGHGSRKDEIDKDIERYFRYVDRFVLENYSNPTSIPLILAALDEHHGLFKNISSNHHLLEDGIRKDYKTLSIDEIREEAWKVVEPIYLEKTKDLVEEYKQERAKSLASDNIEEVSRSAVENRVDKILIDSDKIIPGKINKNTGEIIKEDKKGLERADILDDIAEIVFKYKGEVVVLPGERMPSNTGLAAIYRY